jgi:hypothetical protein
VHELYFYWRSRPGWAGEAVAAMQRLQRRWCEQVPGLTARLLKRADGERPTWMEVYTRPDGLDTTLEQQLRDEGDACLARWLDGTRHLEVFEPIDP